MSTILLETLAAILTTEQYAAGFRLVEEDDHFIYLYREGKRLAGFSAVGTTIAAIRAEAQKRMEGSSNNVSGSL